MKFAGKQIETNTVVVPILRGNDTFNIVLKAIEDPDVFFTLLPKPKPKGSTRKPGQTSVPNTDSPDYIVEMAKWSEQHFGWMALQSLKATPELTFETVDENDPETWVNMTSELQHALTRGEALEVINSVYSVNSLDEDKVQAARESFFHMRSQAADQE